MIKRGSFIVSSFFCAFIYLYHIVQKNIFDIPADPDWIAKLTTWLDKHFPLVAVFMGYQVEYPKNGFLTVAFGGSRKMTLDEAGCLYGRSELVGLISYDYKNKVEKLSSKNTESIPLPETVFFVPEFSLRIEGESVFIAHDSENFDWNKILQTSLDKGLQAADRIMPLTSREAYIRNVKSIQNNILEGDFYELNYCIAFDFIAEKWEPVAAFRQLMKKSPMPFSVFTKFDSSYLLSASPERFLKSTGEQLLAQPIKGTMKRGLDANSDEANKKLLQSSEKERAENLMIVDLMRSDLSKVSMTGSVQVTELFGVYSFPRVHQMISTVVSVKTPNIGLKEIIHATFPMGSMTGAPKIKCMELIEHYENFKRGWFSGTCGYVTAAGDFDFNVLIRSIVYDQKLKRGYFAVGSAITYDSDPAYEYEECLLKASAILEVLEGK